MKRIEFSMTYDGVVHPLHRRVIADGDLGRAELLTWSPTPDATALLWLDGPRDAAERAVAADGTVDAVTFSPGDDGTYAFVAREEYAFPAAVLDAIAAAEVAFLPPVAFLGSGAVEFEAVGEATALSALHDALSELGDLRIERVRRFERNRSPARLTDRQRAALEAAVEEGYYEIPRTGTVEDVAEALGSSTSAVGELIRKAEAAVVGSYVK
ncbi:helix-turn-helix domain-containing protein [Halostella salina]|uniref:helix-turn-helix domain-containing protein n=1 Tax=Halostella salina TaxID=1547897 RepID=UPI00196A0A40|nr:helix-turn-helix domain-containing protein [Halostella salina]